MHGQLDGRTGAALGHGFSGRDRQRLHAVMDRHDAANPPTGGRTSPRPLENPAGGRRRLHGVRREVLILRRGWHQVQGVASNSSAERARPTKVFTAIHIHFTVRGRGIPLRRWSAPSRSAEKYCRPPSCWAGWRL